MLYHALMENFKKDYRFEIMCEDPDDLLDVCSKLQCAFLVCQELYSTPDPKIENLDIS